MQCSIIVLRIEPAEMFCRYLGHMPNGLAIGAKEMSFPKKKSRLREEACFEIGQQDVI